MVVVVVVIVVDLYCVVHPFRLQSAMLDLKVRIVLCFLLDVLMVFNKVEQQFLVELRFSLRLRAVVHEVRGASRPGMVHRNPKLLF